MIAPVAGSGSWPTWIARVSKSTLAIVGSGGGPTATRADHRALRALRRGLERAARSGRDVSCARRPGRLAAGRLRGRRQRQTPRDSSGPTAREGSGRALPERDDGPAGRAADLV